MKTLNPTDGFILHAWMVTELHLSGYEMVAYAMVHQFSQSKAGLYTGGVPYLAAWLNCSENTARKYLRQLEDKGLVHAKRGTEDGVPFCYYEIAETPTPQNLRGTPQNLRGDTSKFAGCTPQNLRVDNNIDNKEKIISPSPTGEDRARNARRFVPPTLQEVANYISQRGVGVDAEEFFSYYTSNGWKVGGRAPMKDWHAAVTTWAKRDRNAGFRRRPSPTPPQAGRKDYVLQGMQVLDNLNGTKYTEEYLDKKQGGHVDEQ